MMGDKTRKKNRNKEMALSKLILQNPRKYLQNLAKVQLHTISKPAFHSVYFCLFQNMSLHNTMYQAKFSRAKIIHAVFQFELEIFRFSSRTILLDEPYDLIIRSKFTLISPLSVSFGRQSLLLM